MQLSVIIVNYNVRHFLEQCLCSVEKAIEKLQAEIIVVDNNSSDNTVFHLSPQFPQVKFIQNEVNVGFGKACNQGLSIAQGEFILFLNPDTLVPEDCFIKCIEFFRTHPDAGGLGTRMLDGSGRFLKESRRAFPSPLTSLFKLSGLSTLFPRSRLFAKYHLGHMDPNKDHKVDVLAGAFMMIRKKVLEKTGGFDEVFFMYGEDVDLSYRIQQTGFNNYYFAGSSIIHFKGESTRKNSLNYVRLFYNAMSIFVRKHYGGGKAGVFNSLIQIAIWLRAGLTALGRFIMRIGMPLIDAGLILLSFWVMKIIWSTYIRPDIIYDDSLIWIMFPSFTILYLLAAYYAGLYDNWYRWRGHLRSTLISTATLLIAYALLPEQYRFSRGILLFGVLLAFVLISIFRWILIRGKVLKSYRDRKQKTNTLIAASSEEYHEIVQLMKEAGVKTRVLGRIAVDDDIQNSIGSWNDIAGLANVIPSREIVICRGKLTYNEIISSLPQLNGSIVKFHAKGSHSIVGSESKDRSGETLSKENFKISNPYNARLKRFIDVTTALILLITFPLHLLLNRNSIQMLANAVMVLTGLRTWIGYADITAQLPKIRKGIMASNGFPVHVKQQLNPEALYLVDYWYAREYEPMNDLRLLWKYYHNLGK